MINLGRSGLAIGAYFVRRVLFSILVVLGVVTMVFFAMRIAPGDPATIQIGLYASEEQIEEYREALGLNKPLLVQFKHYLKNLATGNWGYSYYQNRPVLETIVERLPATFTLFITAISLVVIASLIMGVTAAVKVNTIVDRLIVGFSLLGQSLANFWIGIVLILLFARTFKLLPSYGMGTFKHLILPSITYALALVGVLTRLVRTAMLENMKQDYVRTARAKGLAERVVLLKHVLRNSLIPWVTYLGIMIGEALGGSVVIETVFAWPGTGRLLIDSLMNMDYPVVEVMILLITVFIVSVNLIVDMLYGLLDPRVSRN